MEAVYDGSLAGLFAILDGVCRGGPLPDRVRLEVNPLGCLEDASPEDPAQRDLFEADEAGRPYPPEQAGSGISYRSAKSRDAGGGAAKELFAASANACDDFIHGWMSEFPIAAELLRFAWKVIAAARAGGSGRPEGIRSPEARLAAGRAAVDRGDPAVAATLSAAFKVCREIDRLRGLLRFAPDSQGVYTARCAPDHFVLPSLADHFFRRFGDTPWAIVDEKRRLALVCSVAGEPRLIRASVPQDPSGGKAAPLMPDAWTELWRKYHRAINNESRRNPALQRQFMPVRYWKYLNEI
ncbi:MAG: TIGR03915 family putative DNA repair protein [Treponema sp.]|jgi:hypothetical protein|nr:TIGR03915 family putative DNA repair protein [Treponema sp.]